MNTNGRPQYTPEQLKQKQSEWAAERAKSAAFAKKLIIVFCVCAVVIAVFGLIIGFSLPPASKLDEIVPFGYGLETIRNRINKFYITKDLHIEMDEWHHFPANRKESAYASARFGDHVRVFVDYVETDEDKVVSKIILEVDVDDRTADTAGAEIACAMFAINDMISGAPREKVVEKLFDDLLTDESTSASFDDYYIYCHLLTDEYEEQFLTVTYEKLHK